MRMKRYSVFLMKDDEQEFPDLCVLNVTPHPDGKISLYRPNNHWLSWFVTWFPLLAFLKLPGGRIIEVPIEQRSILYFKAFRCINLFVGLGVLVIGHYLTYRFYSAYQLFDPLLWGMVIIMVALMQYVNPPHMDFTLHSDYIEFEFRNKKYAEEFARLNNRDVNEF